VLTLHVKPARGAASVIVRLLNASDQEQTARLASGQLRIAGARRCTLLEEPGQELALDNDELEVTLGPRAVAVVQLTLI
jgi:alpha-mannosidase